MADYHNIHETRHKGILSNMQKTAWDKLGIDTKMSCNMATPQSSVACE